MYVNRRSTIRQGNRIKSRRKAGKRYNPSKPEIREGEMDEKAGTSLEDHFGDMPDPRVTGRCDHTLGETALPVIYGITNSPEEKYPARDAVCAAQQEMAQDLPDLYPIETDDLPLASDELHLNATGLLTLGQRFADQFAQQGSQF
jgi:hypothetical protein